jgi:hypothetical protein
MNLYFSPDVRRKLAENHAVDELEVEEAFYLYEGGSYLVDDRRRNQTIPLTLWFIGETAEGRVLKIVFIYDRESDTAIIKTAYEPDEEEIELYETNT